MLATVCHVCTGKLAWLHITQHAHDSDGALVKGQQLGSDIIKYCNGSTLQGLGCCTLCAVAHSEKVHKKCSETACTDLHSHLQVYAQLVTGKGSTFGTMNLAWPDD